MSLYAEYIMEREGKRIIEKPYGFATYSIHKDECYIQDIYVQPVFRKSGVASEMADEIVEIAKKEGCKFLTGSVMTSANGSTNSLKVLLAYGFRLLRSDADGIYFIKGIE